MIELRGVSKRMGSAVLLQEATLLVPQGECVGVLGASGAGKTSLLRLIAGLDTPDEGSIRLRGVEVSRPGWALAPHERRIGFQFQDSALWPHMTLLENVAYALDGNKRRAMECLERAGLGALARRRPAEVSGGEARRVGLARALAPGRDILLLDEPLSNLPNSLVETMTCWIREELRSTNAACLWVTHDPAELASFASRILTLSGGALHDSPPQTTTPAR